MFRWEEKYGISYSEIHQYFRIAFQNLKEVKIQALQYSYFLHKIDSYLIKHIPD